MPRSHHRSTPFRGPRPKPRLPGRPPSPLAHRTGRASGFVCFVGQRKAKENRTGVAKKELNIIKLMTEKAAKLDRDTFGVDGAHGGHGSGGSRR
jgi:hypothetical protein